MPRQVWIIASVLTALVVIGLLGLSWWGTSRNLQAATALSEQTMAQLEETRATLAKSEAEASDLKQKLDRSRGLSQARRRSQRGPPRA